MNKITFPLNRQSSGTPLTDLHEALFVLLDRGVFQLGEEDQRAFVDALREDRDANRYEDITQRLVSLFQEMHHIPPRGDVDDQTAAEINRLLEEFGLLNRLMIQGTLVDPSYRPLSAYTLILSEYDLDSTTQVASDFSKAGGAFQFEISHINGLLQGDDSTAPDLMFQVFDPNQAEQTVVSISLLEDGQETDVPRLAESRQAPIVLMNVSADLVVRVVVNSSERPPTEFEQLVGRLIPFMGQIHFADLQEDEQNFQISFLSRETGIEKTKIEQLRDAFQQERQSNGAVPAWVFFGISRQQLPSLALLSVEELVPLLAPLQPTFDQNDLSDTSRRLLEFLKESRVQIQIGALKTSVGNLIQPIFDSEENLHAFLDTYVRHEGDTETFWREIAEDPDFQAEVPAIQLNLQLSQLTLNNVGLVRALQQNGIQNTRQLVDIPSETWETLALEHAADIPAHIVGEDDQVRAKIYAQELQTLVEVTFPTDVIKKQIQDPDTHTFLDNNPDFDFTRTPVESYLFERGEQVFDGIQRPDEVTAQLRQMQRLYTLTANTADMNTLIDLNFASAHQIARLSVEAFARELDGKISSENVRLYHAKAVSVSEASAMVYHQLRDLAFNPTPSALQNLRSDPNALRAVPNWETLFDSLDMCECEHCKSVYSPAAYFVDLLHILLGQNKGAPRAEIFRRRPDLLYTKLSCEHTETLIPYIDLVNEVLEAYVAQSHVGDADAKSHAEISTNDTSDFTSSDLTANPQHPNPNSANDAAAAYVLLESATFPLNLPFDMNLESARQFLQEQNSSRFAVMRTFGDSKSNATRAERLGISEREFEILTLMGLDGVTTAGIDPVNDLWGNPSIPVGQTLGEVLANVDTFLDITSIAYADLISLLATRFLNPNFPINAYLQALSSDERDNWLADHPDEAQIAPTVIELGADANDPCNLGKTFILHLNGEFLSDDELSRFNRFIRLWKKLGCTIPELDALLTALKATDITPEVIQSLSIIWQVQTPLHLPFDMLAVLVGDMPTTGKDSLFARLFLNKATLQIDTGFALNVAQTELENAAEIIADHIPAILAAFRISEEELDQIAGFTSLDLTTAALDLANLSQMYRYVVFAKGLRLKVKALITWLNLIASLPFAASADLLETQALLAKLQRSGFKAADCAYIFQDERAPGHALPPTDEMIAQSAKTLREGLLKIQQENTPTDGMVTADFLKTELGLVLDTEEVTKIIGILDGSNTRDPFNDLLTPNVSDNYADILQNYLTPADVADLAATLDISQRFAKFWSSLETRILPLLRATFVQQHLIAAFKAEAVIVTLMLHDALILQTCVDIEIDTPAHAQAYADQYILMHKFTWLVGKLKLSGKELAYFQNNPNFGGFDWKSFDFGVWLRVADYVALRDAFPPAEQDLLSVFETANSGGDVVQAIVDVTGWNEANVEHCVGARPLTDFLNEIALITLQEQIALSEQIGVSIEQLESWATDVITPDQAQDVKRTLKAKYDEVAWIEVSTEVHNRLRTHLRDALVAYLLQKPEIKALNLKSTNDLYAYFLIDVEMDACMQTSRLKQAISSVQLFVQRCLLNLEAPTVTPNMVDGKQWKWMKNYRVWEANRKVFLYPENWIEPELRDNKSPFFKELESELLQAEITNEVAEQKLMNYLEKLDEVARLDICGVYQDYEAQEFHVFGRSFNTPPQYFYRKLNLQTQVWTAWERVPLDIQGSEEGDSAGVHLMPVMWNRRLYLFWAVFTEKSDREKINADKALYKEWQRKHDSWKQEVALWDERKRNLDEQNARGGEHLGQTSTLTDPHQREPAEPAEEAYPWAYYEVRVAWSEYRQNKWSNKKVSQSFIRTPSGQYGVSPTWEYRFSLEVGEALRIKLLFNLSLNIPFVPFPSMLIPQGEFQFNANSKIAALSYTKDISLFQIVNPKQVNFYQGILSALYSAEAIGWHQDASLPLTLLTNNGTKTHEMLSGSEKEYKILFPGDHKYSDFSSPDFIYQDQKRDYYVAYDYDWYSDSVAGMQSRWGAILPEAKVELTAPTRFTDGINSSQSERIDRFDPVSTTALDQLVETRQIAATTSLQIRSLQAFAGEGIFDPFVKDSVSSPIIDVGRQYFTPVAVSKRKLTFKPFFHAYVSKFIEALNRGGIDGLLTLQNQQLIDVEFVFTPGGIAGGMIPTSITNNFEKRYRPHKLNVLKPYPMEDVDFSTSGAYSLYNWELFFHVPMLIANRLSKNQRFEEAMRWYHFVFNPMTNETLNSSARFWQVIPFRNTPKETLESLLMQLHNPAGDARRKELEAAITAWRNNPFNPHLIARMRLIAYQKNVVMKYLDNLIAWADYLFRQDTIESINEATQLYILAAEICGKRPKKIPARGKIEVLNYAELEKKGLDAFSNALVQLETTFPFFNIQAVQPGVDGVAPIFNTTAPALYFCVPNNEKLMGYWDTIADRLFKIRHCQNIEGVERQLALFEPPIDPGLLVRAVAGGVDISSVLADLNSPLPYYRFNYIIQKALEICAELRSLGNTLLAALEKRDAEALTLMRSQHETMLLNLAKTVRKLQVTEAQRNREGLEKTRDVTEHRANFYAQLVQDGLSSSEKEYQTLSFAGMAVAVAAQFLEGAASAADPLPDSYVGGLVGLAGGPISLNHIGGGSKTAKALNDFARFFHMLSTMTTWAANAAQTSASYQRRSSDWTLQRDVAKKELAQIGKQILAAEIREQIAEQETSNHEQQLENARQVEEFLRSKYTQEELYGWMIGEIATIYFQSYQLAYDLAKKAEKSYRYELGLPSSNFIQFGIWDSFRKGLMSGERLYLSLKQMEKSFMEQNRREYEITKHVSLLQLKPMALIQLRENGSCTVELPETLFDLDYPGHHMRRLKSVSLTIPCVVGPYTSVNCTLTLLRSKTRISAIDVGTYADDLETENPRVVTNFAATESIATSSAQNDSGMFEFNFRDERYLPFEGSGAISLWRIELPADFRQFDYATISDVVLHINYTARQGGAALRNAANTNLTQFLQEEASKPQARLFSLRHEFPSEWHRLLNVADTNGDHKETFALDKQRFPFMFQSRLLTISGVEIFGVPKGAAVPTLNNLAFTDPEGQALNFAGGAAVGLLIQRSADADVEVKNVSDAGSEANWTIQVKKADVSASLDRLEDIFVLCHYSVRVV